MACSPYQLFAIGNKHWDISFFLVITLQYTIQKDEAKFPRVLDRNTALSKDQNNQKLKS